MPAAALMALEVSDWKSEDGVLLCQQTRQAKVPCNAGCEDPHETTRLRQNHHKSVISTTVQSGPRYVTELGSFVFTM
jgi:hypothetical protein